MKFPICLCVKFALARAFITENVSVLKYDNDTWILKLILEISVETDFGIILSTFFA